MLVKRWTAGRRRPAHGGAIMPRWLLGSVIVIYLAGTFGFGLAQQITGEKLDVAEAMSYGASWPLVTLRLLDIL